MEVVADSRDYEVKSASQKFKPISMRFVGGLHVGAEHFAREGQWLILGAAEDCDLLLSDQKVVAHHCLLGTTSDRFCVRALESDVLWEDSVIPQGELRAVFPPGLLKIGEAEIYVQREVTRRSSISPALRHYLWVIFSLIFSMSATYVMAVSLFGEASVDVVASAMQSDPSAEIALLEHERQQKERVDLENGHRIASSLRDVMRLSGIDAESRYVRDGTVETTGFFGDGATIANVIQSRAVREIRGLKRVQVVNKSVAETAAMQPALSGLAASESKMVKIIYGNDPYLVVTDGSRYYPGATLPNGSNLVSILDKEAVLVKTASGEEILMSAHELF